MTEKAPAPRAKTEEETSKKLAELQKPNRVLDRMVDRLGDPDIEDIATEGFRGMRAEVGDTWTARYGENPLALFTQESFRFLKSLPMRQRLGLLAQASLYVEVSPQIAARYFKRFPRDRYGLVALFDRDGPMADGLHFSLFNLCFDEMVKVAPHLKQSKDTRQLAEIVERRKLAPDFLIKNFGSDVHQFIQVSGEAGKGYRNAYHQAAKVASHRNDYRLETDGMFSSPEFDRLSSDDKGQLLRAFVADLQHALVFEEAFNSAFTRESVTHMNEQMRSKAANAEKEFGQLRHPLPPAFTYNPAHSMLFGTRQSQSIYDYRQDFFKRNMDNTADVGGFIEEYPFHRMLLATLGQFRDLPPDEKNADLLAEFWIKNKNPIFANAVADALSAHYPARAAARFMEHIRTSDDPNKNALAAILYRLELGQIGISDKGVRYLERLYDLEELNDPDSFVNRLTTRGHVGVFDGEKRLVGYFNLGDLTTPEEHIRAEVFAITQDLLFASRVEANSPEELQREAMLEDFTRHYFDFYNSRFFGKTGIRFNKLSFREQGQFLRFARTGDERAQESAFKFLQEFGEDGFRTFLALEYDRSLGSAIIEFGRRHSKHARAAFRYFSNIIDAAESSRGVLTDTFGKGAEAYASELADMLSRRAKDFLAKEIAIKESDREDFLDRLSRMNIEAMTFANTFRVMRERGNLTLENLPDGSALDFRYVSAPTAKKDYNLPNQMRELFAKNHASESNVPYIHFLADRLESSLQDSGTTFYTLFHQNKLIGMIRFEGRRDAAQNVIGIYAGGLNVDSDYGNGKLGEALFEASFAQEAARGLPIEAHARPGIPIAPRYLEWGFVADRTETLEGVLRWHMVMDQRSNSALETKKLPPEEIIARATAGAAEGRSRFEVRDAPPREIPEGYLLTRVIPRNGKYYVAFERGISSA